MLHCLPDIVIRDLGGGELTCGYVHVGDAGLVAFHRQSGQVIVALLVQERRFDHRARRDHLHHLTRHQPFHCLVAYLFADGHFVASVNQLGDVALHSMVGHPCQGHPLVLAHRPRGEDDVTGLGQQLGVLIKSLVKVTQAEEKDGIGVLLLDLQILATEGRRAG